MTATSKDPVLVVLQLSGGNDYMNTIVPFADPHYYDNRPLLQLAEDDLLKLDDKFAFNPSMGPLHELFTKGEVAVLHGVGWAGSNRSHFRCMDIWHTAEPDEFASQGWLGKATRQIDPNGENPVTTVNVGQGLPRALVADGVSAASVANIDTYGMLTSVERVEKRAKMLDHFAKMYAPAIGRGPVAEYIAKTGTDALNGADMIAVAPKELPVGSRVRLQPGGAEASGRRDDPHVGHWDADSSTRSSAGSTRTPPRPRTIPDCGVRCRARWPISGTT